MPQRPLGSQFGDHPWPRPAPTCPGAPPLPPLSLPVPHPRPSSVSWSGQGGQQALQPARSRPALCSPADSGAGQRGPVQAEHAGGDHAQRGARSGAVGAGAGGSWPGGHGAQKLTDPPGLVCLPSAHLCLPRMSFSLASRSLSHSLHLVSPACVFCMVPLGLPCGLLPLPSPLSPPHVSLSAPPSPVASFLSDREDYSVRGHPRPVLRPPQHIRAQRFTLGGQPLRILPREMPGPPCPGSAGPLPEGKAAACAGRS